jgi:hypothetical protein
MLHEGVYDPSIIYRGSHRNGADTDGPAGGKAREGETASQRIGVAGSFVFRRD